MRILGINVPFLDEKMKAEVENVAGESGFAVRYYNHDTLKEQGAADVEAFFGMMPVEMVKECRALRWFHCSFAGVDRYCDDSIYPNPDVVLTNSAGAYGITISEHLICTLLMMLRRIPEYAVLQQRRDWYNLGQIRSVYGSTIAVLGMGDIGSNFARRAKAMGANIRGVRRNAGKQLPDGFDACFGFGDVDAALDGADIVVVCLPDTRETRNIIDARRLGLLKEGAYVLNVGRGSAVHQPALAEALKSGRLAGAALDVTVPEPLPKDDPLWDAPNIIITPHVSGNMSLGHTCDLIWSMFMENLRAYTGGQPMKYVVDRKAGY